MGHEDEALRLRQLIMGFRLTQMIYVATKFGIADRLAAGPLKAEALAEPTGIPPRFLYRLLRSLVSIGVFTEQTDGRFAMTPAAELLRRDVPQSLRSTVMFYGNEVAWHAFGRLSQVITTGQSAFVSQYGQGFYDYLGDNPEVGALFHEMMTGFSEQEVGAILGAYDFSRAGIVVDVGGGQGWLMASLLQAHDSLRAHIYDRSPPTPETQELFARLGIANRATFTQGDFFAAVPEGGGLYVLKSIIHNWDDTSAQKILKRCREAMPPDGRLILAERVIPLGNTPSEAKLFDVNMMITVGGQERTEAEYAALFRASGLRLARVIPTTSYMSLIEAVGDDREGDARP